MTVLLVTGNEALWSSSKDSLFLCNYSLTMIMPKDDDDLRLFLDVLMHSFVQLSFLSVLFWGFLFCFYARIMGRIRDLKVNY